MSGPWKTLGLSNGCSLLPREPPVHLARELRCGGSEGAYRIPPSERQAALRPGRGGLFPAWENSPWTLTRLFPCPSVSTCRAGGPDLSPRVGCSLERGPGQRGRSVLSPGRGRGRSLATSGGPPQGRGSGPTLRGVSLAVLPAPPAASAAARRSSAAFSAQSVSRRCWVSGGRSGRGRG